MNLNVKKKNGGFSLVEIMMVVTIIAILSTTVTMSVSRYILERKGEATVMAFYSQLQQLKAFAQRDNDRYLVVLDQSSDAAFKIYRDVSNEIGADGEPIISPDSDEEVQLFVDQINVAKSIEIISSSEAGASGDVGRYAVNYEGWNDYIKFENDEIGTINEGVVFLENNSVKDICYAIVRPNNENNIKLLKKKKSGSAWREL